MRTLCAIAKMKELPFDIKERIFRTIKGDISLDDFEKWIYESKMQILFTDRHCGPRNYGTLRTQLFTRKAMRHCFINYF